MSTHSIDLHGMTLEGAKHYLRRRLETILQKRGKHSVRIITGKGVHSGSYGGGVLAKEIHGFTKREFHHYIVAIQDSPHEVAIDGLPIRGHFDVTLKS